MASGSNSEENLLKRDSDLGVNKTDSIYKTVCHKCSDNKPKRERDKKRLIFASVVCFLFMVVEVAGGIISNSLAIASDAAHLLTDFGAFMVSLAAIWISSKPQTREMSFGFHRAEVLGALISVLSIWLITGILVYMAIERVINLNYELDAIVMLYVSVCGIAVNLVMGLVFVFYKGGSSTDDLNNRKESINIKTAILHVIGDLLQSIGVFIASLVLYFYPHLKIIDPICTFIFSVIVLITTLRIMKDVFIVLMEGFPKHLNFSEVKRVLYSIPGVVKIHNMRLWSLTMDKVALSAHIVVKKGENQADVLKNASEVICKNLNVYEVTLQVEEIGDPALVCSACT